MSSMRRSAVYAALTEHNMMVADLEEAQATIQRVREQIAQSLDERQAYVMIDKLFEALDGDA